MNTVPRAFLTQYRLDELAKLAAELGLETQRVDENRLDVRLDSDSTLSFCNMVEERDTLVGFAGTPWHSHGIVQFMTGMGRYIECDELDILMNLGTGELVIVTQYRRGKLADRWIAHKEEPLELKYLEPGEELRILRPSAPGLEA